MVLCFKLPQRLSTDPKRRCKLLTTACKTLHDQASSYPGPSLRKSASKVRVSLSSSHTGHAHPPSAPSAPPSGLAIAACHSGSQLSDLTPHPHPPVPSLDLALQSVCHSEQIFAANKCIP